MNYIWLSTCLFLNCLITIGADIQKQVVNTAWWPPGTEKTAESVGIVSHGFVYMTAMMELNATLHATMLQEIRDVQDIAQAGGSDVSNLVDCLVNAPKGGAAKVREAFMASLPSGVRPALTVVELNGEYGSFFPTSIACVASLPNSIHEYPRKELQVPGAFGVAAHGLLHIEASGNAIHAVQAMGHLIQLAGGHGASDLVDCGVFVRDIGYAKIFRNAIQSECRKGPPVLTVVQAGLEDPHSSVSLRCIATVPSMPGGSMEVLRGPSVIQVGGKFAFISGQYAKQPNGTDAFNALETLLESVGLSLSDVVNCLFFVGNSSQVSKLFNGFSDAFNQHHPPPPARDELEASSECEECPVVAKCIAALPASQRPSALIV